MRMLAGDFEADYRLPRSPFLSGMTTINARRPVCDPDGKRPGGMACAAETTTRPEIVQDPCPKTIRVMTWNIHGGVGPDRRRDLTRIVDLVRRHEPQVVALQEIDSRLGKSSRSDAFEYLGEELGGNAHATRLITAPDGDYGHAVISRWPMTEAHHHDISYRRRERRAAIETVVHTPHGPLHLVAAHLGLSFRERHHQAIQLADITRRGTHRTVLLGDLNDWIGRGSVQRVLDELFPGHSHIKTFPSLYPLFPLDRIYCRPTSMLLRCWTDPAARIASDHLPVIADLVMEDRDAGPVPKDDLCSAPGARGVAK